ncbi:hypothetical protein NLI96_g10370 [Meripilus lineatus]|uniref:Uncharacterized protein n=1 Tax=Meripilus lineatus TaxID=2056292 RepID=A0AAD5UW46_9APHY|nr:hypothetical protein NLI96_g10370 [Physisporinus lineatus]
MANDSTHTRATTSFATAENSQVIVKVEKESDPVVYLSDDDMDHDFSPPSTPRISLSPPPPIECLGIESKAPSPVNKTCVQTASNSSDLSNQNGDVKLQSGQKYLGKRQSSIIRNKPRAIESGQLEYFMKRYSRLPKGSTRARCLYIGCQSPSAELNLRFLGDRGKRYREVHFASHFPEDTRFLCPICKKGYALHSSTRRHFNGTSLCKEEWKRQHGERKPTMEDYRSRKALWEDGRWPATFMKPSLDDPFRRNYEEVRVAQLEADAAKSGKGKARAVDSDDHTLDSDEGSMDCHTTQEDEDDEGELEDEDEDEDEDIDFIYAAS